LRCCRRSIESESEEIKGDKPSRQEAVERVYIWEGRKELDVGVMILTSGANPK